MTAHVGQRFGKLVVIAPAASMPSPGATKCDGRRALVRCDCGVEKIVRLTHLLRGFSRSCGCARAESIRRKFAIARGDDEAPVAKVIAFPRTRPLETELIGRLHLRYDGRPITASQLARVLEVDVDDLDLRGGIFRPWLGALRVGDEWLIFGRWVCSWNEIEEARQQLLAREEVRCAKAA